MRLALCLAGLELGRPRAGVTGKVATPERGRLPCYESRFVSEENIEAELIRQALAHNTVEWERHEEEQGRLRDSRRDLIFRARAAGLSVPEIAELTRMTTRNAYYFLSGDR